MFKEIKKNTTAKVAILTVVDLDFSKAFPILSNNSVPSNFRK